MKKRMFLLLFVCFLLTAVCGALAQEITVLYEHDDGSTTLMTDGDTVMTDGEITVRFDGLTDGMVYRVVFSGETIDGEAFKDYQGFVAEEGLNYVYLLLTDKAGTYGPFELTLTGGGLQETISFRTEVKPSRDKDWISYGVLNNPAMAALPPFLAVEPGYTDSPTIATRRVQILEPADGAVLSGFSFGEIYFTYEVLEPDTEIHYMIMDTKTGKTVYEGGDFFHTPETHGLALAFDQMFAFDRDYIFEVTDGSQSASVSFRLTEEEGGDAQGAQQILDAREEMSTSYHAEDAHGDDNYKAPEMDENSRVILEGSQAHDFIPLEKYNIQSAEGKLYDKLAEAFNESVGGYATGMNMENGVYKYCNSTDEGGMLQSWALSGSYPVISEPQRNAEDAMKHMVSSMQFGFQIEQVYRQMLGDALTSQMPVNMKRIQGYAGNGQADLKTVPVAYASVALDNGTCVADMLLYALKINDKPVESNRYIFVRFMDPLGDGSQVYEWNIADQAFVKEFIGLIGAVEENKQTAAGDQQVDEQRYVRIRNDGSVNVRSESNADSRRVGTAKANGKYLCLDVAENGWFQIQLEDGTRGYVSPKMAKLLD